MVWVEELKHNTAAEIQKVAEFLEIECNDDLLKIVIGGINFSLLFFPIR